MDRRLRLLGGASVTSSVVRVCRTGAQHLGPFRGADGSMRSLPNRGSISAPCLDPRPGLCMSPIRSSPSRILIDGMFVLSQADRGANHSEGNPPPRKRYVGAWRWQFGQIFLSQRVLGLFPDAEKAFSHPIIEMASCDEKARSKVGRRQ